mgnify:CR=1 FL=1
MIFMSMLEWAKTEVEIAKKRERGDKPENEWDYGCACYDSALKAYESLLEDEHSGMSIMFTKHILNRLIDGKPLTPIENTDDIWNQVNGASVGHKKYQCKRMSSLFKDVYDDGRVDYTDIDRVSLICIGDNTSWHNGRVTRFVHKMYPIKFPYLPTDKPYKLYQEDFMYKKPNVVGEYDRYAWLYLIRPDGTREEINKYFAETDTGDIEITKEQYYKEKEETFGT